MLHHPKNPVNFFSFSLPKQNNNFHHHNRKKNEIEVEEEEEELEESDTEEDTSIFDGFSLKSPLTGKTTSGLDQVRAQTETVYEPFIFLTSSHCYVVW